MGKTTSYQCGPPSSIPLSPGSIFPAEINKVGTEETIAELSVVAPLIHPSSALAKLMTGDHRSTQNQTELSFPSRLFFTVSPLHIIGNSFT